MEHFIEEVQKAFDKIKASKLGTLKIGTTDENYITIVGKTDGNKYQLNINRSVLLSLDEQLMSNKETITSFTVDCYVNDMRAFGNIGVSLAYVAFEYKNVLDVYKKHKAAYNEVNAYNILMDLND